MFKHTSGLTVSNLGWRGGRGAPTLQAERMKAFSKAQEDMGLTNARYTMQALAMHEGRVWTSFLFECFYQFSVLAHRQMV